MEDRALTPLLLTAYSETLYLTPAVTPGASHNHSQRPQVTAGIRMSKEQIYVIHQLPTRGHYCISGDIYEHVLCHVTCLCVYTCDGGAVLISGHRFPLQLFPMHTYTCPLYHVVQCFSSRYWRVSVARHRPGDRHGGAVSCRCQLL